MNTFRQVYNVTGRTLTIVLPKDFDAQQVEVVVRDVMNESELNRKIQQLKKLFKKTQALHQAQAITEEEIAAEIAAYRSGK